VESFDARKYRGNFCDLLQIFPNFHQSKQQQSKAEPVLVKAQQNFKLMSVTTAHHLMVFVQFSSRAAVESASIVNG
jgi:hypothetical protein